MNSDIELAITDAVRLLNAAGAYEAANRLGLALDVLRHHSDTDAMDPEFVEYARRLHCLMNKGIKMKPVDELEEGTIVQLNPHTTRNRMFAGCLMVVTELKSWGAQGYVQALGENGRPGEQAYYRAKWDEIEELTGGGYQCPFIVSHEDSETV